ncbi:hypothetical protein CTAYLR_006247 [Chrysophaeum taylorii]|uniref:Deubiquitinating enzyme MINDY-3/4 conserved domain-containing protein n=1 Tax=Chrysophaeum taylorii TaxID=2483200 RepID=A0AAD7XKN7_9STRA|nr:hypothetical protein CTAYLR_006247 [Chrysophaeum taylorii]
MDLIRGATGCGALEAAQFLEMAGSVEAAIRLHDEVMGVSSSSSEAHSILFGESGVPGAWLQGIEVLESSEDLPLLVQRENGPCGALAALNALALAAEARPARDAVSEAMVSALGRCGSPKFARWRDRVGGEISEDGGVDDFFRPGGLALFCLSLVLTRGAEAVRNDVASEPGSSLPLVSSPHAFCGPELIDLLVRGVAAGSFFSPRERGTIGFLARDETNAVVSRGLKTPELPIFVLHGGDHFTLLWRSGEYWRHWNGLEPHRKLSVLRVENVDDSPPEAPRAHRAVPGELESVVQSRGQGSWRDREYELSTWTPDFLTTRGETPSSNSAVLFDFRQYPPGPRDAWRCLGCYHSRFETGRFGANAPGLTACAHCGKPRDVAGWTFWRAYSTLPDQTRRLIDRDYAPSILATIRTRWRLADLSVLHEGHLYPLGDPRLPADQIPVV